MVAVNLRGLISTVRSHILIMFLQSEGVFVPILLLYTIHENISLTLNCYCLLQISTGENIFDLSNNFTETMCHMGNSPLCFIEIAVNAVKIHFKHCYFSNALFAFLSSGLLAHISPSGLWRTCVENTVP